MRPALLLCRLLILLLPAPLAAQQVTASRVAGNVWRIDGAIDVIVALGGPDGLLMLDTGYPFAETGVRAALRRAAGTDSVALLLNTHAHHGFSNHIYAPRGRRIAHSRAAARLRGGFLMAGQLVAPVPREGIPDSTFEDSLRLRWNGEDISLIHFPGGHTDSDAVVFFHTSNVVATGDLVVPHMPWISVDEGAGVQQLLRSLDRLLRILPAGARIVPGHDSVTLERRDLVAFRDMIASATATVARRMRAGQSLRRIKQEGLPALAAWRGTGVPEALFIESIYRSLARARQERGAPALELGNGRWWDGSGFVERTMYSVGGVLTGSAPARIDQRLDLGGRYAVPGFGDAHTHRLAMPAGLERDAAELVRSGVYAAMVQDPIVAIGGAHRASSARWSAPEAVYTQGVITPSWGVVTAMYRRLAAAGVFGAGVGFDAVAGRRLHVVDSVGDLDRAWPDIRRANGRFLKVIVAFSDEVDQRRADPARYGADPPRYSALPGVTPDVLRYLVRRAHADGLEVSAHIETAADFRLAVAAGADWIAHLPGSWQIGAATMLGDAPAPWMLTAADARAARMAGTVVITTLSGMSADSATARLQREVHRHNLRLLRAAGVTLAIGSDAFDGGSTVDEAILLRSLDVFSNAEVLNLLSTQTTRLILPGHRTGLLREGWEASFVVLGQDPVANIEALREVRLAVKRGRRVDQ